MNPAKLRRLSAAVAMMLLIAVPTYAAKRRAVQHRPPGVPVAGTITGLVLDDVTGAPVAAMTVRVGFREAATNAQGRFELTNVTGTDVLVVQTERSGYLGTSTNVGPNSPRDITIRVTPTPTVMVRRTNGQVLQVDTESVKFGYAVPFSGYRDSEFEDFCKTDGTKVRYHNNQLKRLVGPATNVAAPACCASGNAARMSVTLRTGETTDLLFTDTCDGRYEVDLGGRDHVSGQFVHILITDIAEIVFPN